MAAADAAAIAKALAAFGIATSVAGFIGAAIAIHLVWEAFTIKASDKGQGVLLYVDPSTREGIVPLGVVIAHTRTDVVNPIPWAVNGDGPFKLEIADDINFHIDRGVGSPDDNKFILVNDCDWKKAFDLRIGADRYWVQADGHSNAENATWNKDLPITSIELQKPQFFGRWGPVGLTLHNFEGLHPQDVTTFTWVKDT